MRLTRLTLTQFRNYPSLTWRPDGRLHAVTGPNGSGKTNLLEAISLLAPGRGLRGARNAEFPRQAPERGEGREWGVNGRLLLGDAEREIGTGSAPVPQAEGGRERRVFRLDGQAPRSQTEIAATCACVWLTPQMDRLFQEGASGRRRFLDRLVWALEPGHAREVSAYETAMAGRNRLLARGGADPAWLAGLEDGMARHAVAVAAARIQLVDRLNAALDAGAAGGFPPARLSLQDAVADRMASGPAIAAEDWLRDALAASRGADAASGGAGLGAHRADMLMADAATGLPAGLASTGQQKALLIGTVLGHAGLIAAERVTPPLLLLDEPAVHLDAGRRALLWDALRSSDAQVFITGTDREAMLPLGDDAHFWRTGTDQVLPDA